MLNKDNWEVVIREFSLFSGGYMPALRLSIFLSLSLLLLTPLFIPTVSFSQVQPAVESTYRGDINEDGKVDIFDLLALLKVLGGEQQT